MSTEQIIHFTVDNYRLTGTTLYVDGGMTLYPGFREGG